MNDLVLVQNFDVTKAAEQLPQLLLRLKAEVDKELNGMTISEFAGSLDLRKDSHKRKLTGLAKKVSSSRKLIENACMAHEKKISEAVKIVSSARKAWVIECNELRDALKAPVDQFKAKEEQRLAAIESAMFDISRYRINAEEGGAWIPDLTIQRMQSLLATVEAIEVTAEVFQEQEQDAHEEKHAVIEHIRGHLETAQQVEAEAKAQAEAEAAIKAQAEAEAKIQAKIERIKSFGQTAQESPQGRIVQGMGSVALLELHKTVDSVVINDSYGARQFEAVRARQGALDKLAALIKQAQQVESEQANADAVLEQQLRHANLNRQIEQIIATVEQITPATDAQGLRAQVQAEQAKVDRLHKINPADFQELQGDAETVLNKALTHAESQLATLKSMLGLAEEAEAKAQAEERRIAEEKRIAEQERQRQLAADQANLAAQQARIAEQQRQAAEQRRIEQERQQRAAEFAANDKKLMSMASGWFNQLMNAHEQVASYLEQHDDVYKSLSDIDKEAYVQERCFDELGAKKAAMALAKALKYSIKFDGLEIIIK